MARDIVRGLVVVIVAALLAEIMVETRLKMAAVEWVARGGPQPVMAAPQPQRPVRRMALALTDWADAALEIVR